MSKQEIHARGTGFAGRLAAYAGSSLLLNLFRLAYAYAKPKFLKPADLGLWNLLSLIPQYAAHLHLGSQVSIVYRIPRLLAEGGQEQLIQDIKATTYWFSLAANTLLSATLVAIALMVNLEPVVRDGLLATALYNLLNWYHAYQLVLLKAYQQFAVISTSNVISAVTLVVVCIPLVALSGIYGVFIGAILSRLFSTLYIVRRWPLAIAGRFNRALLWDMILDGFPVMVFTLGLLLVTTSDRLIIAALLDREAVGYYAVAVVIAGLILQIPTAARDMLEPQLMMKMVHEDNVVIWRDYFRRPLLSTSLLFPLMWGPIAFLSELMLSLLLPDYVGSVDATIILAHGVLFLALIQVIRGVVVANGLQTRSLVPQALGLACNLALSFGFVSLGYGITGVAVASGIAFALVFLLLFDMVRGRSHLNRAEGWRLVAGVMAPLIYSIAAITVLHALFQDANLEPWVKALAQTALYLLGATSMIAFGIKKAGGITGPLKKVLSFLHIHTKR